MKYSQRSRDRNYIEASSFDVRTLNLPSSQIRHKTHLMETELENSLVSSEVFFGIPCFFLCCLRSDWQKALDNKEIFKGMWGSLHRLFLK